MNNKDKPQRLATYWKLLIVIVVLGSTAVIYLDATIRSTFTGKKWSIPSIVYARPLEIYVGAPLTIVDLKAELKQLNYHFVSRVSKPGEATGSNEKVVIYTRGFQFSDELEPPRKVTLTLDNGTVSQLSSDDNSSLLRLEPVVIGGIYPAHHEDRLLVKLSEVPLTLQEMLIAVEDDGFYDHYGISLRGIARAFIANIKEGGISQGASTLTQQLIKNYYLSSERTLSRKVQEAVMALLLELHFDKSEILEGYINEIYLGQDGPRAIHGFGLASQYYFQRPLANLSIAQQALLVAIVRGPSYYNPWRNPERLRLRRNLVLDIAVRKKQLTPILAEQAKRQPLGMDQRTTNHSKRYPAYLDLVRRQLQDNYQADQLSSSGLSIFTYFDPLIQENAESVLATAIAKHKADGENSKLEGAVIITRPNTGAVVAVVGGRDARYAGFNRALDAHRPVGSLIKPAVFLTALEQSDKYNLATLLDDGQYTLTQKNGDSWSPQNYDHKDHGEVLLYQALAHSYNQATARLGNALGLDNLVDSIHRLGFERQIPALPAITLGALDMAPIEIAQIYQTLSADGFYTPLLAINNVMSADKSELKPYPLQVEQRFDGKSIYLLRHALQAVTHEGTARSLQWRLPDFAVAGKTGTTDDLRDSWFAGFSGDLLAVVWLGRDDNQSIGLTGSSGALPIWAQIFKERSRLPLQNLPPADIVIGWVDPETGKGSQEACANAIPLPFIAGTAPSEEIRCRRGVDQVIDWFRDLVQ
ncbi:penicillin-binding protein 1B [Psychromonas antarctica]|uniref:penicillin-binding protein 1B n=1 Tax=Psychromonas antarctica TaxID=67573 RepID=UPI001EE95422|nr:penicillin-binding protein 1B [Psychromonas antarctica]